MFPEAPSSYFWSGSPYAFSSNDAWYVLFAYGYAYVNPRSYNYSVRLVRGGQSFGSFDSQWVNTTYTLTITPSGTGSGTVTSNTGGINCGATCSASYTSGTSVILTATPTSGSTFAGWSGACANTSGTCTVSSRSSISATTTAAPLALTTRPAP